MPGGPRSSLERSLSGKFVYLSPPRSVFKRSRLCLTGTNSSPSFPIRMALLFLRESYSHLRFCLARLNVLGAIDLPGGAGAGKVCLTKLVDAA